jgi:hypothetical protein
MAHRHAPNHPRLERKESGDSRIHSSVGTTSKLNNPSHEMEKAKEVPPSHQNKKSVLDYEIAGLAWPLVFVMSIIVIAVLGMILKAMGVF